MVMYRRNRLTGGTYFFTVNLHNRASKKILQVKEDDGLSEKNIDEIAAFLEAQVH